MSNATLAGAGSTGVETADTLTANALVVGAGTKDIAITNTFMVEGTVTTISNVTGDVITLALGGTPAGYRLEAIVQGFVSTPHAPGWSIMGCARTTGAASAVIGTPGISGESDGLLTVAVAFIASGNNIIVRVTGENALTINWRASLKYISEE